ncbi:MAG: hypothetical protein MJ086_05420 [Lachnospiraceae bacterium]|nr:hypothetical protein [Lachnospiraceae bacterium]
MKTHNSIIYELADKTLDQLNKDLHRCRQILATLPEGHLIVQKSEKYYSCYHECGKSRQYLGSDDNKLILQLAKKAYIKKYIRYAENEVQAIEAYLKKKNPEIPSPSQYLTDHPFISQIISPALYGANGDLAAWANAPYDQTSFRPEGLTIRTAQGHLVRSKSECIIANALLASSIPYRYEEASQFNGIELRPDFKIYKENGELFIWEHLGLLDKEEYVQNALWKIKNYISAGFYPGVNLILTADTEAGQAIDSYAVQKIIDTFLL